jgi:hypothetical protein
MVFNERIDKELAICWAVSFGVPFITFENCSYISKSVLCMLVLIG